MRFSVHIDAAPETVWNTMLGPESYREWAAAFCAGSYYEGSWDAGEKIRFLAPSGDGMTSVIAESRPYEFVSIKHVGVIKDGAEDTESDQVRKWAPAFENYTFIPVDGGTEVQVDMDVAPEWEEYMGETWPKALEKLKALCVQ